MKRKLFALIGIAGPVVLIIACLLGTLITAGVGWWLFDEEESARIIRIMSLAPLATPQTQPAESEAQVISQPAEAIQAEAQPKNQTVAAENNTTSGLSEEALRQRNFTIPEGMVNALTQEGLANRLVIPKLNLDAPIVLSPIENQTWKVDHLGQAVGHLEGTAPAGSNSNIVLAGHITLSAGVYGPFAGLGQLAPGDVIYVYDNEEVYQYIVDGFETVDRTAINVTYPSSTGQITLITCSNWDDLEGRYVERLVVKGHLVEG
jgi:sortase A